MDTTITTMHCASTSFGLRKSIDRLMEGLLRNGNQYHLLLTLALSYPLPLPALPHSLPSLSVPISFHHSLLIQFFICIFAFILSLSLSQCSDDIQRAD